MSESQKVPPPGQYVAFHNDSPHPRYVGGLMIAPFDTRMVPAHQVPRASEPPAEDERNVRTAPDIDPRDVVAEAPLWDEPWKIVELPAVCSAVAQMSRHDIVRMGREGSFERTVKIGKAGTTRSMTLDGKTMQPPMHAQQLLFLLLAKKAKGLPARRS